MRRRVLTLVLALTAPLLILAAPAPAAVATGERVWTATACYAGMPYNGAWLGTPGVGASYSSVFADYDVALQWITWNGVGQSYVQLMSNTHAYYAAAGYECGRFGLPYKTGTYSSLVVSYRWTYFAKPGNCDMPFIVDVLNGGPILEGVVPDYFCQ